MGPTVLGPVHFTYRGVADTGVGFRVNARAASMKRFSDHGDYSEGSAPIGVTSGPLWLTFKFMTLGRRHTIDLVAAMTQGNCLPIARGIDENVH